MTSDKEIMGNGYFDGNIKPNIGEWFTYTYKSGDKLVMTWSSLHENSYNQSINEVPKIYKATFLNFKI